MPNELLDARSHFAFGKNWADYSRLIGEQQLAEAMAGLQRLLGDYDLCGRRFLDIGSGSGLHALAAVRMGATEVVAVDIDAESVKTTREVLKRFAPGARFRVEHCSVFDLARLKLGTFDVVYSWGVLHHTGDLATAVRRAAELVADGGIFVFALYRRTWLCKLWAWEKRWYTSASERAQRLARQAFKLWAQSIVSISAFRHRLLSQLRRDPLRTDRQHSSFGSYVANYVTYRGMDFHHDVHDWLGGFPYESVLPGEVDELMAASGLSLRATHLCAPGRGKTHGLLGSGCDEYVYIR